MPSMKDTVPTTSSRDIFAAAMCSITLIKAYRSYFPVPTSRHQGLASHPFSQERMALPSLFLSTTPCSTEILLFWSGFQSRSVLRLLSLPHLKLCRQSRSTSELRLNWTLCSPLSNPKLLAFAERSNCLTNLEPPSSEKQLRQILTRKVLKETRTSAGI